ncbi:hypothetical protein FACS1894190_16410 [Spirochaetia bacterium]|nr:hypothetical protein FACS1894190_16410 [Spirochaetia bacterium]
MEPTKEFDKLFLLGLMAMMVLFVGCPMDSDDSGGSGGNGVVAQNITAAEIAACPTTGTFKDIDALIATKLASDTNDTFTFPAGVNVAVSVSNLNNARIIIPASIVKGVKGVSTEAQLNTYKATATWIDTLGGMKIPYTLPAAQVAHKVAFAELAGAELVPVYVHSGMIGQVNTSTGGKVQRQFANNVALFFYNDASITSAAAAEAALNAQNLHFAAGQPTAIADQYHIDEHLEGKVAWYRADVAGDISVLRFAVMASNVSGFLGMTISGLGTITSGGSAAFTYDTTVASLMNKQPKYTLKSVLGDIEVSQATYVAAVENVKHSTIAV